VPPLTETLARKAVERSLSDRETQHLREMTRIMEATYAYIERTGNLEPSLRDILAACGLSTQGFYRIFRSKDELMLVLLDDGRRRLVDYLSHRMDAVTTAADKVRAFVEGVLAQAGNPRAAARTRPFVANEDRLAELFPTEQRESVDLVVALLADALAERSAEPDPTGDRQDAEAVYQLVFGILGSHLILRTRPSPSEIDHAVRFCLRGVGLDGRR
jgi:AcrR family transcriptional regulator